MLDKLKEYIASFTYLGVKEVAAMVAACRISNCQRGDFLVASGEVSYKMFFVLSGLLRCHVVKNNGEERTVFLASEGMFVGSPRTLMSGEATNEAITALEDTWVAVYDTRTIDMLADEYPKIQKFYLESMKRHFYEAVGRIEFHTVINPIAFTFALRRP